MKKLMLVMAMAAMSAAAVSRDPNDPNRFADYAVAMRPELGNPMAVEWQDANREAIDAATTDEALAACVESQATARSLLSRLRGAYGCDPMTLTKIAAVSQWVMGPEPCFLCFWRPSPADGRKVWVRALLDKAELEGDPYIKTFCLDQLRWCAPSCPCVIGRIERLAGACEDKAVKDFAAWVIREIRR